MNDRKKLNIMVTSLCYYPDDFRINDITRRLAADGHRVRVMTGLPDYATSKVPPAYRFFRRRREIIDGIEVVRVPIIARRGGLVFRILNYASFVISGCLYMRLCRFTADVVFSYQTSPVMQSMPAVTFARRKGIPLVLYCCDIWPEAMRVWNVNPGGRLFAAVKRLSGRVYRAAAAVPVSSAPFRPYLIAVCGVSDNKIYDLPQHAEDTFADIAGLHSETGSFDFLFAGNIGAAQSVDTIVRAAARMCAAQPESAVPFHIHIVGDGSEKERCRALAEDLAVTAHITFHGRHPLAEMPHFYHIADAFLLTMTPLDIGDLTLPAKFQGYICAGKPVIAAAGAAAAAAVSAAGCGLAVEPGDPDALAAAMQALMNDRSAAAVMGARGRAYYEREYTEDVFMCRLYAVLENVMPEGE